ncbi:glycosyltransferase [bacterium]|nr:glycosyltransferase [bacterium]
MDNLHMKLVITGGHHSSAIPVIKNIQKNYPEVELFWIGHRYSQKGNKADTLEYIEITKLGLSFYDLKAGKFYKTFDPIRLAKIPFGFFQAFLYLLKTKPDKILSFGGYLAVPVVLAGWVLKIPSVTHEQTAVAGYANKLISKFAKKILISWDQSRQYFPKEKVIYTGLPLRETIFEQRTDNFEINKDLPTVYITAGKTGSHIINTTVLESLEDLLNICNVIHQCGEHSELKDFEKLDGKYKSLDVAGKYHLKKYVLEDEIGEAFGKATLVVSRAGAHIINELIALEKPCVLIPIPWVSHNEQHKNAEVLVNTGLGRILEEKSLTSEKFINFIKNTLNDLDSLKIKDGQIKIEKNAAKKIVKEVFAL